MARKNNKTRSKTLSISAGGGLSWERVRLPLFWIGLILLYSFLVALLVNRHSLVPSLELEEFKLGGVAPSDVVATANINIADESSTARARAAAEKRAGYIYFFNSQMRERQIQIMRSAFSRLRKPFLEFNKAAEKKKLKGPATSPKGKKKLGLRGVKSRPVKPTDSKIPLKKSPGSRSKPLEKAKSGPGKGLRAPTGPSKAKASPEDVLLKQLHILAPQFIKLFEITEENFKTLAAYGFSREMENSLIRLYSPVMGRMVVKSQYRLLYHYERKIKLASREVKELVDLEKLAQPSNILDEYQAKELLESSASKVLVSYPRDIQRMLIWMASRFVQANLTYDHQRTINLRQKVKRNIPVRTKLYKRGQNILRKGDPITQEQLEKIKKMLKTGVGGVGLSQSFMGNWLFIIMLVGLLYFLRRQKVFKTRLNNKDILFLSLTLLAILTMIRLSMAISEVFAQHWPNIPLSAFYLMIPVAIGALLIRTVLSQETALIFSLISGVLTGILMQQNLYFAIYAFVGSLAAVVLVQNMKRRSHVIKASLIVGGVNFVLILALSIMGDGQAFDPGRTDLAASGFWSSATLFELTGGILGSGMMAVLLATAIPIAEALFGYTTDIKLIEMASTDHPLLKELVLHAPGTYHHSIVVGTLVETAAEAIGANPLLARVGAYYHDMGKIKNPHYFAENQGDRGNPHDKIKPSMSALILKTHVKDGVEILQKYKMPQPIIDIALQHSGTNRIEFFLARAVKQAEEKKELAPNELDFRYPGPKPQFPESALVFLADAVEAATRSIPDPTPARLKGLVQHLNNSKFVDGQLDECDLTLKDLHDIARAFTRVLTGIYHHRPQYPGSEEHRDSERRHKTEPDLTQQVKTGNGNQDQERPSSNQLDGKKAKDKSGENLKRLGMS